MHYRKIYFLILLCSTVAWTAPAFAQEELTLAQAIQMGLENNFDIQITKQQEDIAQRNNSWGVAGRWPTLTAGITQSWNRTNLDNPAGFLQSGNIKSSDTNPVVNLNWVLFDGLNIFMTKARLEQLEELSAGNTIVVLENTIQGIILAYTAVLLEQERLDVFQSTMELSRDRYDYGLIKADLGSSVTFDILQDKNAYLTDSSNFILQEQSLRNAKRNLNLLLNIDIETNWTFSYDLNINIRDFDYDELVTKMAANNSNLRNQYINLNILQKEVEIAKAPMYPRLSFGAGYAYDRQVQDLSDAEFAGGMPGDAGIVSSTANYNANFTLAFTLFDGTRIRRQLQNAKVQERIGSLEVNQLKRELELQLNIAHDQYNLRRRLLNISNENAETTKLNLDLGEERYRNGTLLSFNFRDLQRQYLLATLEYIQDRFEVVESYIELLRLTGGIMSEYNVN